MRDESTRTRPGRSLGRRAAAVASGAALVASGLGLAALAPQADAAIPAVCATPGRDGSDAVLTGVVNTYYPGTGTAAAGATSVGVGTARGATAISTGDLLLVIQMQDATINTTNSNVYGSGSAANGGSGQTSVRNSGLYEYVVATGPVASGAVPVRGTGTGNGLRNTYTAAAGSDTASQRTFQVVRVPQYGSASLGANLTAAPWNGSTGGVLAVDVAGRLDLAGRTASVSGLGFRGGAGRQLGGGSGANTDYRTLSSNNANGQKGEGYAGTPRYVFDTTSGTVVDAGVEGYANGSAARGAPGNAGGGGTDGRPSANDQNTGGGGGGGAGVGGVGGNAWSSQTAAGGRPGAAQTSTATRALAGGGGGAGTRNNSDGITAASAGAAGGGIALVRVGGLTGTGTIEANGADGNAVTLNDGGGGGGGGGAVVVTGVQTTGFAGLTLNARGGRGALAWPNQTAGSNPGERHGPGGGGGGGTVRTTAAPAATSVTGGAAGTTTTAADTYGAAPGAAGATNAATTVASIPGAGSGGQCAYDLAITKTGGTTVPNVSGQARASYTVTVVNNGPQPASTARWTDVLPAGTTYQSMTIPSGWSCARPAAGATGTISCTRSSMPAGATSTFTVVLNVTATSGSITNAVTTTADGTDLNPADNSSSTTGTVIPPPVAVANSYQTTMRPTVLTVPAASGLLSNDSGSGITVISSTAPARGTRTVAADGSFTYTPNTGVSGTDSFTYTIRDAFGRTATATATIVVTPQANNNSYSTPFQTTLNATTVLTNDAGSGPLGSAAVVAGSGPAHGAVTMNANGTFTYVPATGFSGSDSFRYTMRDTSGTLSNEATVTIAVGVPAIPVAVNDAYATGFETPLSVPAPGVLSNDSGVSPSASVVTGPAHGSVSQAANGSFLYTPVAGFSGIDTYTYRLTDPFGQLSNVATVRITVAPRANNDGYLTPFQTPISGATVLANDLGVGPLGSVVLVGGSGPANGTLTLNANGTFLYTPANGFSGSDSFRYTMRDAAGTVSNEAIVTIGVGTPAAPVAVDDAYATAFQTPLTVPVPGVLGNDAGYSPSVAVAAGPTHGSLTQAADGSFSYTPAAGFSGVDSYTYQLTDPFGQTSNLATVRITVAPHAVDDGYSVVAGQTLNGSSVLVNDLGVGPFGSVALVGGSGPANGTLSLNPDGTFTYTPTGTFTGTDSFRYTMRDAAGTESDEATVTITVTAPAAPVAVDDAYATALQTPLTVPAPGVLANDSGTSPSVSVVAGPSQGSLTQNGDGSFLYTPTAGFSGVDSYTYRLTDPFGQTSNVATVTITVAPLANDDAYSVVAGQTLSGSSVLTNDQGSGPLGSAALVPGSGPANGTLTLNADGTFSYTPTGAIVGTDTFRYTMRDASGKLSNPAVVTITVTNQPPIAVDDQVSGAVNGPTTVSVLANDSDPDGHPLTIVGVTAPSSGGASSAVISGSTIVYTPKANFTGYDLFTYTISDGFGGTATASVRVLVSPEAGGAISVNDKMVTYTLGGLVPGTGYTQRTFTTPVSLSTQILVLRTANGFVPAPGDQFDILLAPSLTGAYASVLGQVQPDGTVLVVRYLPDRIRVVAMAGIFPDSTADAPDAAPGDGTCAAADGSCTLRAAAMTAIARPGPDAIVLAPTTTYPLTIPGAGDETSASGDLDLEGEAAIVGQGSTVQSAGVDRALHARPAGTALDLSDLTISGGNAPSGAGGVQVDGGDAHLVDVSLTGNRGTEGGGIGLSSGAELSVVRGVLSGNVASVSGGAVHALGNAVVDGTTVQGNSAPLGGGISIDGPTLVRKAIVTGNQATSGAGIAIDAPGNATIVNTTVSGNVATGSGGGLRVVPGAAASITDSRVTANEAVDGAGGEVDGTLAVLRVTFDANVASGRGGALAAGGPLIIDTSTLSGNRAATGGALAVAAGSTTVISTTITATGGTGAALDVVAPATVSLRNSIVADQQAGVVGCSAAVTSNGYNLTTDTTCGLAGTGDAVVAAAGLGPLANNGGFSPTHLPAVGTPAFNAGPATCAGPDQRAFIRPRGAACDKGAVER